MKRKIIFIFFILFVPLCFSSDVLNILPHRILKNVEFDSIGGVAKYKNIYFISDFIKSEIFIVNKNRVKILANIGINKGSVYKPLDIIVKNKEIFILDFPEANGSRVQIFNIKGIIKKEIKIKNRVYGMAVDSKSNIYLGEPQNGKLISKYDKNGYYLKSFGKVHKFSSFYGKNFKNMDKYYKTDIRAVNISIDKNDNVFLSFLGAPFFQKYDNKGKFLFEKMLDCKQAREIISEFRKEGKSPVRRAIWKVSIPYITTGITIDSKRKDVYVSFQWDRGWIYVYNLKNNKSTVLKQKNKHLLFQKISMSEDFSDLILPRNSSRYFNQVYLLKVDKLKK